MSSHAAELMYQIKVLENELELELAKARIGLRFGLEHGKARFDEEILRLHRQARTNLWRYVRNARPFVVLSAPLIYGLIVPLLLLDAGATLYHTVCFPIYRIEKVRRADYIVFDRHHLAYLNALEKLNCAYCSYANGLIGYVGEIAARTEAYWCPIKHARRLAYRHQYYAEFADYGDVAAYRKTIAAFEAAARDRATAHASLSSTPSTK